MTVFTSVIDRSSDERALRKIVEQISKLQPEKSPGLFLWVVGSCHGIKQWQQAYDRLLEALSKVPLPIVGVAMGQLDSAAQELLDACDYVYSDGNTILYADQVYPSLQALSLACSTTAELMDQMTPTQLHVLKNEMLWAKVTKPRRVHVTAAPATATIDQIKAKLLYDRQGSWGSSSCSTDVPENEDGEHLTDTRQAVQAKQARFVEDAEVIPVVWEEEEEEEEKEDE